jgi:hypothetical protein
MLAPMAFVLAGLAVLLPAWGAFLVERAWPAHHTVHVALYVAAGMSFTAVVLQLRRRPAPPSRRTLATLLVVAALVRLPFYLELPLHSDDVYRYLWDGKVQRAGVNPYLHPPDAPALRHLSDDDWTRVNYPHLPTIYPPLAEALFFVRALLPLPPLLAWKLITLLFDGAVLWLLLRWLARRGRPPADAVAWAWSPLVAIELGQNGHMDTAAILLVLAALYAWQGARPARAGALLGLATATKLFPAPLFLAFRRPRALAAGVLCLALAAAPYLGAGAKLAGSLGEYGRRWRVHDGAFALLSAAAERLVPREAHADGRGFLDRPRLARLISGRDRDEVFPDELAGFAARAVAALLLLGVVMVAALRRLPPLRFAEVTFGVALLLLPALHPWYALWMLPLVALGASPAWLLLAALVPLGYLPLAHFRLTGEWHDPIWTRALTHGVTWLVLLAGIVRRRGELAHGQTGSNMMGP